MRGWKDNATYDKFGFQGIFKSNKSLYSFAP